MRILIKDDYLKNPNYFREIALSLNNYRIDNDLSFPPGGWRGQRSRPLRELKNIIFDECDKEVLSSCYKFFDLENFRYRGVPPEYQKPESKFIITSYFHITTNKTRTAYYDFWQDKFHKDTNTALAGVIYLNPDPPSNSGTSVFDAENNQFSNIENVYNRFICYEGSIVHGLSDVFGDSVKTGRLTYTFFIHEEKFLDFFVS
jgi:hypothetical protein